ncbi:MAG: hypothetical protein Q8P05_03065 [Candidatus Diapherotrites archaeon]|nr:hypothetical protein [Candidatus Diapherotrites archaeon]MDZ4256355.1 hypothetical protein [archaeon]
MEKKWIIPGILILVGILAVAWALFPMEQANPDPNHTHADFAVYIHNERVDFSQPQYMSTETQKRSPYTHLHDGDGEVMHIHALGVTLGLFFHTLDMRLTTDCFTLDTGASYCTDETNSLRVYVNGQPIADGMAYQPQDLDQILITFGDESPDEIQVQLDSLTDKACIPSKVCPWRGTPEDESSCSSDEGCLIVPPSAYPDYSTE